MTGPLATLETETAGGTKDKSDSIESASQCHGSCTNLITNRTEKENAAVQVHVGLHYSVSIMLFPITAVFLGYLFAIDSVQDKIFEVCTAVLFYTMMLIMLIPWIIIHARYIIGWIAFHMILERCLPDRIIAVSVPYDNTYIPPVAFDSEDVETKQKTKLPYRKNGHLALWVTLFIFLLGWPTYKTVNIDTTAPRTHACYTDHDSNENHTKNIIGKVWNRIVCNIWNHKGVPIAVTTTTTKTVLQFSTFPYWSFIYNYVSLLAITTTVLCLIFYHINCSMHSFRCCYRYRLGLLSWLLLNISFGYEQYFSLGYNTEGMILVQLLHFVYIWDALYYDKGTSAMAWSIAPPRTADGVSFWSLWYHLCCIPFSLSMPTRYLVHSDPIYTAVLFNIIVMIYLVGQMILRHTKICKIGFNIPFDEIRMKK